uniref:Uncharacterized protein n=1 Tax=Arundo donax TaxID=35708 RepID=A0A0A9CYQ4_ARUDO
MPQKCCAVRVQCLASLHACTVHLLLCMRTEEDYSMIIVTSGSSCESFTIFHYCNLYITSHVMPPLASALARSQCRGPRSLLLCLSALQCACWHYMIVALCPLKFGCFSLVASKPIL